MTNNNDDDVVVLIFYSMYISNHIGMLCQSEHNIRNHLRGETPHYLPNINLANMWRGKSKVAPNSTFSKDGVTKAGFSPLPE